MAYAASTDLVARYDERTIQDLASDTGTPVDDLGNDAKVSAALDDASGRIDAALTVANLYAESDLTDLTGNSLALLKRITCELALIYLIERRPEKYCGSDLKDRKKEAEEFLDRLRKGERLFGIDALKEAGLPTVDGPTAVDYKELNLITSRTRNYYPNVKQRLPIGR